MSKLMLLGARQFLDMPKGTFYIQHWQESESDALAAIQRFKADPLSMLDFRRLQVYGNNQRSMRFAEQSDDFMCHFADNVVGANFSRNTVYLVLDDSFVPDVAQYDIIKIQNGSDDGRYGEDSELQFARDQVFRAREKFLEYFDSLDNLHDIYNDWARHALDVDEENSDIYNLRLECDID